MMQYIDAFIYGVILSFGLIIPLGAQNIFIFNQGAIQRHYLKALPSVVTASLCDTLLITMAVLGVSVVVLTMPWLQKILFLGGFCFLMFMSWMTWHATPSKLNEDTKVFSAKQQIAFSTTVSLLNPHAILDTIGVIGTNSLDFIGEEKWIFTLACIVVSWMWFFGLSIAGHFMHKLDKTGLWIKCVNKISAVIIFGVGLYIGKLFLNL